MRLERLWMRITRCRRLCWFGDVGRVGRAILRSYFPYFFSIRCVLVLLKLETRGRRVRKSYALLSMLARLRFAVVRSISAGRLRVPAECTTPELLAKANPRFARELFVFAKWDCGVLASKLYDRAPPARTTIQKGPSPYTEHRL